LLKYLPSGVIRWVIIELTGLLLVCGLVLLYGRLAPGVVADTAPSPVAWVLAPTATAPPTTPRPGQEPTPRPVPPTITPTATAVPTPTPVKHTVQSGESLSQIAGKYGVTNDAIAAANSIRDRNALQVGQELVIPMVPVSGAGTPVTAPRPRTHIVQEGDILGDIAGRYGVTTAAIIKANNLEDADSLKIGQELTIPGP
jgi:N-acetylmuramoyl-L-alanine amidase